MLFRSALTRSYRDDFGKYAPRADKRCLDEVLVATARGIGRPVKYASLAPGFKNDVIHAAFDLLEKAGLLRRVPTASPAGRLRSLHLLPSEYPQCSPGMVLSEAPYAELPEQGLTFVPLYYAGTLLGQAAGR